jgi:5-methyltetrahydrofolate--homocysteine methyltransferase
MDRQAFHRRLGDEILVLDGAMGSLLQEWGLPTGTAPEAWNLENPEALEDIHRLYVASGADIILTNTFGANRPKLDAFGLGERVGEINRAAVETARRAARGSAWIAASVGPLGENLHPLGELSFDEALEAYREQVGHLAAAEVDIVAVETVDDLRLAKAAAIAAREVFPGPVVVLMTFGEGGVTVTGAGPEAVAAALGDLDIDGVGANCSLGPEELLGVMEKMAGWTDLPLLVEPNAGLPILRGGKTVFPGSPALLADCARKFVDIGLNVIGGCCGTTPKHIGAVRDAVKELRPVPRKPCGDTVLAGRRKVVRVGEGPFVFIGECLNPSGAEELGEAAREGRWSVFAREARRQVQAGADVVDVNVGMPGLSEGESMTGALRAIQARVDVPLCIDTSDPAVMAEALKEVAGKALLNSVTAETARLEAVLPLVKKYGAAVVGLALDEEGVPDTAEGRLEAARKILNFALSLGIRRENVLIDPLVMAVSAGPVAGSVSLEALRRVKQELRVRTVMGVSNISHGLPLRGVVNAHFLLMAFAGGLDLPLIDPFNIPVKEAILSSNLLLGRDPYARRFLAHHKTEREKKTRKISGHLKSARKRPSPVERLYQAVIEGARDTIVDHLKEVLREGTKPVKVTEEILVPALEEVGVRYNRKQFFLPQMVLAAEAVQTAFVHLKTVFRPEEFRSPGSIVIATVRGDIHEIGKNIVAAILENHGFSVVNLGKDVDTGKIIEAAYEHEPDVIGLSALMTTTMVEMEKTVALLRKEGLEQKILVGGAVVTDAFAREIGADGYGGDAMEAVVQMRRLVGEDDK